ncbi:MAG TPA: DUF4331 domain-containing protein [Pyrinomonadaceae bacterium]|nr:DUF4331 domain-containing protein [Pyrinomonadaceae bacterium]
MQKTMRTLFTMAIAAVTASSLLLSEFRGTQVSQASSHREAPLIALDQSADNTDVYAFVSPDRANTVTLIANFIPLEEPSNGPNFYKFDDNALYQIRIDNNGDARIDLAIQFRFRTVVGNGNTFLYNTNTIDNLSDPDWNVKQFMDVTARIRQGDPNNPTFTTFNLGTNLPTPPVNIGPRSTPNYETNLAEASITSVPTGVGDVKVFAGQRDDSFYIDTGSGFDLLGLRPFNSAHLAPLPNSNGVDFLAGYNVHTIAIQVPSQLLTASGQLPTGASDPNAIIGVYSTVSRPGTRVLNTNGTATTTGDCSMGLTPDNNCVQVSRLANPLVNELFIPRGTSETVSENDKDLYNAQLPATDINRDVYVRGSAQRPVEPVALINLLYPPVLDAPTSGRNDLVRVFLTGVPGATRPPVVTDPNDPGAGPGAVPSDLMRLNVAVPATPFGSQNRLGFIAGDLAGYPNGRRPIDDVTDISFRVAAGVLLPGNACAGGTANCNQAPNNQLGDGVNENDRMFRMSFPYLASPWSGYENPYHGRTGSADTTTPGTTMATPRP